MPQTTTTTTPTIPNATSTTILPANSRREMLFIQNNSAGNVMVNLEGSTLTGIVPTDTNKGIVLAPGASLSVEATDIVSQTAITAYQASGASINTLVCVEGVQ